MKQHITPKQLNELSEKGKKRLREWWKPEMNDLCSNDREIFVAVFENEMKGLYSYKLGSMNQKLYPLCSIGQMIEFLDNHIPISIMGHQSEWHGGKWYWNGGKVPNELTLTAIEKELKLFEAKELCDALWEAVKEVLKGRG